MINSTVNWSSYIFIYLYSGGESDDDDDSEDDDDGDGEDSVDYALMQAGPSPLPGPSNQA